MTLPRKLHGKQLHSTGFTLLEVVIACVLLAVLLTAVVSVWRVLLNETQLSQRSTADIFPESLARQLRRDIINARGYRTAGGQLELIGYVAQAASGEAWLTPAIARYRIRPTALGGLLVREQQLLSAADAISGGPQSAGNQIQPLWLGATAIGLTSTYIDTRDVSLLSPAQLQSPVGGLVPSSAPPQLQSLTSAAIHVPGAWQIMPPLVELTVLGESGRSLFRESIVRSEGI